MHFLVGGLECTVCISDLDSVIYLLILRRRTLILLFQTISGSAKSSSMRGTDKSISETSYSMKSDPPVSSFFLVRRFRVGSSRISDDLNPVGLGSCLEYFANSARHSRLLGGEGKGENYV